LKVILASIEHQLGGKAAFDWNPKGLKCVLSIPRSEFMKSRVVNSARVNGEANGATGLKQAGKLRVLLVEDEALVAMMIRESLTEFGFHVIGPVCTVSEAEAVAKDGHPDAAVLDINIADGLIYSVAEILAARGVPFVFVTGYDAETVDSRFREIPVLQKPIEREMLLKIFQSSAPLAG
jgi:chemotaxis family two-component system sensor kinase Cph1